MLWHYIIVGVVCLVAGFWIGGRHGRKVKRDSLRELNTKSLDLLKTRAKYSGTESQQADSERKERLLHLSLQQLKAAQAQVVKLQTESKQFNSQRVTAEAQVKKLQLDIIALSKTLNHNQSLIKVKAQKSHKLAIQSHKRAIQATTLARKATLQLKRLETAFSAKKSRTSSMHKRYGASEHVSFSVVDQPRLSAGEKIIKQVSSSDSTRMAKLTSSKEARRPLN